MALFSNKSLIIGTFLLVCFIAFIWILGADASIRVHDNLDANIAWYKSLADQHLLFADSYTPNRIVMDAPRIAFGSEWSLVAWLYVWFPPMVAYNFNLSIMAVVAFIGTYLFTKETLQLSSKISPIIALTFAFLPFLFTAGISVAGQPLLFWSFAEILKKQRLFKHTWGHWLLFFLYPFYAIFIISGLFTMVFMVIYLAVNYFQKNKNINYFAGIICLFLLSITAIFVDYRLFLDVLSPANFTPHRVEFVQGNTFLECLKATKNSFLTGQNHFPVFHTYLILPTVFVYLGYGLIKSKFDRKIFLFLVILVAIALIDGFWNYVGFEPIKNKITVLKIIQFDRFYSLYPILWTTVFVLIIRDLSPKIGLVLASCQVLIVLFFNQTTHDFVQKVLFKKDYISYREFYAEDLFSKVKKVLKYDKDFNSKVGMIGLHPTMAQYNEIATVDGYVALYSLAYKHEIQAIIQAELNQNKFIKTYFEQWGSRCYLFDNEAITTGNGITKNQKCCTNSLDFDYEELKQMNCNYLLSAVEIKHPSKQLKLLSKVEDANWRIWIYEII